MCRDLRVFVVGKGESTQCSAVCVCVWKSEILWVSTLFALFRLSAVCHTWPWSHRVWMHHDQIFRLWFQVIPQQHHKIPIYIWYEGYDPHVEDTYKGRASRVSQDTTYGLASLNLTNVREDDQGWYECKVFYLDRTGSPDNGTWIHLDVHGECGSWICGGADMPCQTVHVREC